MKSPAWLKAVRHTDHSELIEIMSAVCHTLHLFLLLLFKHVWWWSLAAADSVHYCDYNKTYVKTGTPAFTRPFLKAEYVWCEQHVWLDGLHSTSLPSLVCFRAKRQLFLTAIRKTNLLMINMICCSSNGFVGSTAVFMVLLCLSFHIVLWWVEETSRSMFQHQTEHGVASCKEATGCLFRE